MVQQTMMCPHCRANKSMSARDMIYISNEAGHFTFLCENCEKPLIVFAKAEMRNSKYLGIRDVKQADESFQKCGWRVVDTWPKPAFRTEKAPAGVPDNIATLFEHSQDAASRGAHDLAIMGFHRVLKMAQAKISSDKPRKLHPWVLSLIESGHLSADMRSWANSVKGLRSDVQDATVQDAEEFGVFVHVLLEQLFGIRSKIASYRNRAAKIN